MTKGESGSTAGANSAVSLRTRAPDLVAAFDTQATRIGATVHPVRRAELGPRLAQLLQEASCKTVALATGVSRWDSIVQALDGSRFVMVPTPELRPTRRADAGISIAKLGVAETGSVLLHSSSEDRRVELCVDVHVVVLDSAEVVPTLDSASAVLQEIAARPPAYASLVTGPSRSADIERQITIGVHGPRALHIVRIEAEL
jgi:L-lactate dehydrogenase complex protein LldG